MERIVLWIDDSEDQRDSAREMLGSILRIRLLLAEDSTKAEKFLNDEHVNCVVTDIMRRSAESVAVNEGYEFFREFIRPRWPTMPVIFHTKNLPWSFEVDAASQYLSKWDPIPLKKIELEGRVCDSVRLYEAFCDHSRWLQVKPRLVEVNSTLLEKLKLIDDAKKLPPDAFEQLVAELLQAAGFKVLWAPGGSDGGVDIVAGCDETRILIDVKRYLDKPVGVEMVRSVYGVATAASLHEPGILRAGIITSNYFTAGARMFRDSTKPRILLRDWDWLRSELEAYAPNISSKCE